MPASVPQSENLCLRTSYLDYTASAWCLQKSGNSLTGCGLLVAYNPRQPDIFKQMSSKANNSFLPCVAHTCHEWCAVKVLPQLVFPPHFSFWLPYARNCNTFYIFTWSRLIYTGCLTTKYASQCPVHRYSRLCALSGFASQFGHLFNTYLLSTHLTVWWRR